MNRNGYAMRWPANRNTLLRFLSRGIRSLLALVALGLVFRASASSISMSGTYSFNRVGSSVTLDVARVDNNDPAYDTSGTLELELWATANTYSGGTLTGYKLAH